MNLSVVIPVFKSAETLPRLLEELKQVLASMKITYEIIFVDDCSSDNSWAVLKQLKSENDPIKILRLANNVGQWMATLAGISRAEGDLILTIDDDLEYDTNDIVKLYDFYHQTDSYLVYGIPYEKKNKNLSYKLFFTLRDRFLRLFFGKIKTESFKIFDRNIYFSKEGKMFSNIHFEAYTKFTVSDTYVQYVAVNYRKRFEGHSNHTLWMKTRILFKYGIEYFRSPFRYLLYLLLLLGILVISGKYIGLSVPVFDIFKLAIVLALLTIFGILGNYLSNIYFIIKGLPEYIIIEEH